MLSVALACRALTMMAALLDDLQVEPCDLQEGEEPSPAQLHILTPATALQRAARILTSAPLNQFLFYLATISYRKANLLYLINNLQVVQLAVFLHFYRNVTISKRFVSQPWFRYLHSNLNRVHKYFYSQLKY